MAEVIGSIPIRSTKKDPRSADLFLMYLFEVGLAGLKFREFNKQTLLRHKATVLLAVLELQAPYPSRYNLLV